MISSIGREKTKGRSSFFGRVKINSGYLTLLLIFTVLIPLDFSSSQTLKPIPVAEGTRFFYKPQKKDEIKTIAVAGTFNNWKPDTYLMTYDTVGKYWFADVPLKTGIEFFYKFVLNGNKWITDPNAHNVTEDEWRNSIIIPQKYGAPFVQKIFPPQNKRVIRKPVISVFLKSEKGEIDEKSILLKLNNSSLPFKYDKKKGEVSAEIKGEIEDGEHRIFISFADKEGNSNEGFTSFFFLDRYIHQIETPAFYDSAIVYEIYIRQFSDSDGDGIGDFNGITSRLGYLQDTLGVNVLWLMPWNESTTDHGYNVVDYFSIEKDYGTYDDYIAFIQACKQRNIRVLMDFVINHTDSTHSYFLDAYRNPQSKFSSWYQFTNSENTDWNHFGVERKMPKLNFDNKEVQDYFIHIAKFWMDPNSDGDFSDGVDGFRCDAAKEVPHSYWNRFRKEVKKVNKEILLLGEVWDNPYFLIPFFKEEFDMLFDYPVYYGIEEYLLKNDVASIKKRLSEPSELYPVGAQTIKFLSNHDNDRPVSKFNDIDLKKIGLGLIFTLPGTPMIYYGDELGFEGVLPPENVRQKFDWQRVRENLDHSNSIFNFYRDLILLRNKYSPLWKRHEKGGVSLNFIEFRENELFAYLRTDGKKHYLIISNNSGREIVSPSILLNSLPAKIRKIKSAAKIFDLAGLVENPEIKVFAKQNKFFTLNDVLIEKRSFVIYELL
ncbi:MAG: hypothetical protein HUU54_09510 [Ignavibacteriaceae bacterium]|nr:hypothetical protein [Ignavibacteriaceae bacterium]